MNNDFRTQTTTLQTNFPFKGKGLVNDRLRLDVSGLAANTEYVLSYDTTNNTFAWESVSSTTAPYAVYTALLTQTGTDAPVATVLENTLGGTVVWSYNNAGDYTGTLAGVFVENKTWCIAGTGYYNDNATNANATRASDDTISLLVSSANGTTMDNWSDAHIEIRVYP